MRRAAWAVFGLLSGLAHPGCSGQAPEHARPSPAKSVPGASEAEGQPQATGATPAEAGAPSADCSQEPPLALRVQAQVGPAGIGLSVINGGPKAVRLSSAVALLDARGQTVDAEALRVRRSCAAEACVALEPGAELLSPPWLGLSDARGELDCGELVRPSQPGSYQLVLRSCECKREQRVVVPWPPS